VAVDLLRSKNNRKEPIADDPVTGHPITVQRGRYGEYLELGQTEEEKERKEKPRRVSVPKGLTGAEVTPEIAQKLIQLPRTLGEHPDDGAQISTGLGRYGPYLKHGDEFRSLESWQKACDIELAEALEILKQPKPSRKRRFGGKKTVLKEIGELEGAAGKVQVLDGPYGPYVTDGETNASVPKGTDPKEVTPEQAQELLEARRKAPKKKRRRRRR
jgi:DNA topoisomerase-1